MLERVDAVLAMFIEGVRRGPAGSALPGIAPSNPYLSKMEATRSLLATVTAFSSAGWQSSTGPIQGGRPSHRHSLTATAKGRFR